MIRLRQGSDGITTPKLERRRVKAGAVLLAAGRGRRAGVGPLKQLRLLGRRPLSFWPLRALHEVSEIIEIIWVVPRGQTRVFERLGRRWKFPRFKAVVAGGATRNESVCRGTAALSKNCDVVLVHDAARPLVSPDLVRRVLAAANRYGAALAAIPVKDTLKREHPHGFVKETVLRDGLWMAQTPQGFRRDLAIRYFSKPDPSVTDDVQVFEGSRVRTKLVLGSTANLKVTYPEDFELCRSYLKALKTGVH